MKLIVGQLPKIHSIFVRTMIRTNDILLYLNHWRMLANGAVLWKVNRSVKLIIYEAMTVAKNEITVFHLGLKDFILVIGPRKFLWCLKYKIVPTAVENGGKIAVLLNTTRSTLEF